MSYLFGEKLVSDALLDAVNGVTTGKQTVNTNGEESELKVGDSVVVGEGSHKGMTGEVMGFKTSGKADVQLNRGSRVELYNSNLSHDTKTLNENLDNFGKKKAKKFPDDKDGDGKVDEEGQDDEVPQKDKIKNKANAKVKINPDLEEENTDDRSLANLIKGVMSTYRRNQYEALEVGTTEAADDHKAVTPGESPGPADDMGYDKSANVGPVSDEEYEKMLAAGRKL